MRAWTEFKAIVDLNWLRIKGESGPFWLGIKVGAASARL